MTWIAEPAEEALSAVERYENLQALAVDTIDMLAIAADRLSDYAGEITPGGDTGTIQLAVDLRRFREQLLGECRLQKPTLPREVLEQLRADFNFIGMTDPEERRKLVESVACRPVERLAELTQEEADQLRAEIQKLEEPF